MANSIIVEGVSKQYGDFWALNNVSLEVERGEFYGCFGPNGAGKSTLIKILTGQLEPTKGNVTVLGIDARKEPIELKKKIGIVPESETPPSFLTGYEYLYFVCRIRELQSIDEKVSKWIRFFDLDEKKDALCKDMSKGMRQKLMLAAAFIHSPELLFLDEPFINLDPIYQKRLREYLTEYVKDGGTIFMCSHILEIAEKLCSKIAVINKGKILAKGKINELREKNENLEAIFMRLVEEKNRV